jgi:hypothetical protein
MVMPSTPETDIPSVLDSGSLPGMHLDAAEIIEEIIGAGEFAILRRKSSRDHRRPVPYVSIYPSKFIWFSEHVYELMGKPRHVSVYLYRQEVLFSPVHGEPEDPMLAFRVGYRKKTKSGYMACPAGLSFLIPEEGVLRLYGRLFKDKLLVQIPDEYVGGRDLVEYVTGHSLPPGTGIRIESRDRRKRKERTPRRRERHLGE